jgi:hypothetical protein
MRPLESAAVVICALLLAPLVLVLVQRTRIRLSFDYAMKVVANQAVKRARQEHQVMLDFSPASVQRLEEDILAKLHEAHLKTPLSEQDLSRISIRLGAYLGETLKRSRPGRWHRDSQKVGRGTTPVVFEPGTEAFPCSWVYKRIADGPEDNVAFKFQVFTNPKLRQHLGTSKRPEG